MLLNEIENIIAEESKNLEIGGSVILSEISREILGYLTLVTDEDGEEEIQDTHAFVLVNTENGLKVVDDNESLNAPSYSVRDFYKALFEVYKYEFTDDDLERIYIGNSLKFNS